jgi:hypothetical protein
MGAKKSSKEDIRVVVENGEIVSGTSYSAMEQAEG